MLSPRVLELGGGLSAAYAAKLLADHGADVVKLEPPGGDPTRRRGPFPSSAAVDSEPLETSGTFLVFNVNKRGLCVDLDSVSGQTQLAELLDWADIIVHSLSPGEAAELGLDSQSLRRDNTGLVVASITPFGATGARAEYVATELIVANAGGWAALTPATESNPELPPLKVFGHQCALLAGINAAMVALAVWRDVNRGGGEHIDLAEADYIASVLEAAVPTYGYLGHVPLRYHGRRLTPWRIFQAKDAPVFLVCVEDDQWARLVEFMGRPDWATVDIFATLPGRSENADLIHALIAEFVAEWPALELFHEAQKRRICVAPVMSFEQLGRDPHLAAREFFTTVEHPVAGAVRHPGSAILSNQGRAPVRRPAPLLDQHRDEVRAELASLRREAADTDRAPPRAEVDQVPLPLAGIRVVDFSWAWAGPFCSLNLAHLGADVIRLESSTRLDIYRRYMINAPGMPPGPDTSAMFNQFNQGKRSVSLNLSSAEGKALVKRLVTVSDVVVQNFGTGVMDRLGLGYEALRELNPGIVVASISGYGQTGPYARYMGYGPAAAPLTGLCSATGYDGQDSNEIGLSMPDPTAGLTAAWAVVSALAQRDATGTGSHLDVSLWEATAVLAAEGWMQYQLAGEQPRPNGNRDPQMAPHGCFRCRGDDAWIAIACEDDGAWRRLAELIAPGLLNDARFTDLAARKANEDALEAMVADWTRGQDRWQATETLQARGIAAFPSLSCADVVEDPHLNARGLVERLDHPVVGQRPHIGIPWRYARRPNGVRAPAPCLGADTHAVLTDVLGMAPDEIAGLEAAGVLR